MRRIKGKLDNMVELKNKSQARKTKSSSKKKKKSALRSFLPAATHATVIGIISLAFLVPCKPSTALRKEREKEKGGELM